MLSYTICNLGDVQYIDQYLKNTTVTIEIVELLLFDVYTTKNMIIKPPSQNLTHI